MSLKRVLQAATVSIGMVMGVSSFSAAAENAAGAMDALDPEAVVAEQAVEAASWVIASNDHEGLPFAVVDKKSAQILIFNGDGAVVGLAPVLIGSAKGDTSAEGIADRELKDIPAKDRTTPAGRFLAAYGPAAGNQRVLWVDFETAVSIHPLPERETKEQRGKRLASLDAGDNRITHGCINVAPEFYTEVVQKVFAKGGVFYVLPDEKSLAEAFPSFSRRMASASEGNQSRISFMGD